MVSEDWEDTSEENTCALILSNWYKGEKSCYHGGVRKTDKVYLEQAK